MRYFIFFLVVFSVYSLEARSPKLDKQWDRVIQQENLSLPKKQGEIILEKMARVDNTIQYFFRTKYKTKSPNMDSFIISTRKRYCNNLQTRAAMFDGYRFYHNYKLANGIVDLEFFIEAKDCESGAEKKQHKKSLPQRLKLMTNEVAKSLPIRIDKYTVLNSVYSMDDTITYIKELDIKNKEISHMWKNNKKKKQIIHIMKESELKAICNEPTVGMLIKNENVKIIIRYLDRDSHLLFQHTINRGKCDY